MNTVQNIITEMQPFMLGILVICVIVFAIIFIKDRAWMKLLSFVAFATIIGVIMAWAPQLFGKQGKLTKDAGKLAGLS